MPESTHCPFCALQCGMHVSGSPDAVLIAGNAHFPVNKGGLCVKGWSAGATLGHRERLTTPLVRDERGALQPATWEAALDTIARRTRAIQTSHGADAVGVFGSGALTNEKAYLLGKFARVARPRTSITTGVSACRRGRPRRSAPSASIAACPFRWKTSRVPGRYSWPAGIPARRCRR